MEDKRVLCISESITYELLKSEKSLSQTVYWKSSLQNFFLIYHVDCLDVALLDVLKCPKVIQYGAAP